MVPAYNVQDYVGECLDSLLGQTFKRLEVIVVNDGSTDATPDIVNAYASRDPRVTVLHQANSGQGTARNLGVGHARGEFIAFVDADDTVPKKAFAHMVARLRRTGSDFCVGSTQRFHNGRYTDTVWAKTVHIRDVEQTTIEEFPLAMHDIIACNRLFRTDFWRQHVGSFRERIAYEDHVPMLTAYVRARSFDILSETTYHWRKREDQSSTSQQKADLKNMLDRVTVKEEAHELLLVEASEDVYDAWLARALEVDLPAFVEPAQTASPLYRSILAASYRTFLGRARPAALAEVRFVQKARAWLVSHERWDELGAAEAFFRENRALPPTEVLNDRLIAQVPAFLDMIPQELRELSPVETRFDGALESVRWDHDGHLAIRGWVFIRGLDMPATGNVTSWLQRIDGDPTERVSVRLEPEVSEAACVWGNDLNAHYEGGGFQLVIDPAKLGDGQWQLVLQVADRGIVRTDSIHQAVPGGSAEFTAHHVVVGDQGHRKATAGFHRSLGFILTLAPSPLTLVAASAGATKAAGTISVAPHVRLRRLWLQSGSSEYPADFATQDGDSVEFTVEGVSSETDARLLGDIGAEQPCPVAVARSATGDIDAEMRWQANFMGTAKVSGGPGGKPLVHSAHVLGDELVVGLVTPDEALTHLYLGNKRLHVTAKSIERTGRHTHRAVFPLQTSVLGGPIKPLPSGNFRIRLDVAEPALVASPDLNRSAPMELTAPGLRISLWTPPGKSMFFAVSVPMRADELSAADQKTLQAGYRRIDEPLTDSVLFQCYRGEFATDSQRPLDEALRTARPELTRYWGVADASVAVPEGAVPLFIGSREWYQALATSRYLCNNIDFDGFFRKRPGQKYLQTFHGYPFKSMGRSFWSGKGFGEERIAREIARRNVEYDAILVPSERSGEFYRSEYDYTGTILVTGYPRSDFPVTADRDVVRAQVLERLGIPRDSTVILYAPTYRDNLTTRTYAARRFDELELDELTQRLGPSYTVLLRGHNNNQRVIERVNDVTRVVDVTDYPEINDLTVAADAAVLDYSSLRFDWALTGKPVVFFVPDQDIYFGNRPPLFPFDESAPGPRLTTTEEVAAALADLPALLNSQADDLAEFNRRYNALHDGHATERVIDAFFLE